MFADGNEKPLDKEKKKELIDQLLHKIEKYPLNKDDALSKERLADLHISVAYLYSDYEESFDQAMDHFFQAFRLLEHGTKLQKATLKGSIASMCYGKKDFINAVRYYQDSLSLLEPIHKQEIMIGTKGLGMAHLALGNTKPAVDMLLEAADICVDISDVNNYMDIILILKKFYAGQDNWEMVIEFEMKALEILKTIENDYEIAMSYLELGLLYLKLEKYDVALNQFKMSVNAALKKGDNNLIYQGLIMVAETYFNLRILEDAKNEYLKALALASYMNSEEEIQKLKIILTNINTSQKKIADAIEKGKNERDLPKKYKT